MPLTTVRTFLILVNMVSEKHPEFCMIDKCLGIASFSTTPCLYGCIQALENWPTRWNWDATVSDLFFIVIAGLVT